MTETSEDKTKRNFAALLLKPIWKFRYSVFYADRPGSKELLKDQKSFRQALRRKYPDQPFLIRIQVLQRGDVSQRQAYLTLYTTQKAEGIDKLAYRCFPAEVRVPSSELTLEQCKVKAHKILTQRPHDLTKIFGNVPIRRYGVLNKHLLLDLEAEEEVQGN